jgi:hypothetical protein
MRTEVVSRHIFRRTARKQERDLERRLQNRIADDHFAASHAEYARISYRVSRRSGGFRWVVEKVTR